MVNCQRLLALVFVCGVVWSPTFAKLRKYEFASVKILPEMSGHGVSAHIDTQSRHFDVHLEANHELFSNDFVIDDGSQEFHSSNVLSYSGTVTGNFGSTAIGSVANNRFEGTLFFNGTSEAFYLEDGSHLAEVDCRQDPFYTSDHPQFCTVAYFDSDDDYIPHHDHKDNKVKRSVDGTADVDSHPYGMCGWSNPAIAASLSDWLPPPEESDIPKIRQRRVADAKPKVCNLYMQVDTSLWSLYMSDYKNNAQTARTAVIRLVADIVQGVTNIYRLHEFYTDDGTIDKMSGFAFQVSKVRIFKKEEVCASTDTTEKQLCPDFIDSDAFLKINSEFNHDSFCLAYIVSHRHFSGGVMGLAWLGYPTGYVGGVCQRQARVSGGSKASYNTGIITSNNQGSRVTKRSLTLTFAHEVGHNFGSPHDSTQDCIPSGSAGYYLMYPYVNPGDKANNDKFSPCSRNKIALNLDAIIQSRSGKANCFKDVAAPFCGNQVREEGEQCDCGLNAEECKSFGDNCCTPADGGNNACKLKAEVQCSPSQGPCCESETCSFAPAIKGQVCAVASECSDQSFCGGFSAVCPVSPSRANFTRCASNTRRCYNGECSQSICAEINYEACQEPMVKGIDSAHYCYLSCRAPVANSPCISALNAASDPKMKELMDMVNNGQALTLPPGSPCDEFRGVCDPLRRCRLVNTQGPLARMFLAITGKSDVESAGDWLVKYWWVVAICAVVFIAISFCCLKYCSDLLPTSNPKIQGSLSARRALTNAFKPTLRRRRPGDQPVPTNPPPF